MHLSKAFYPYCLALVATQEDAKEMKILFETTNAEALMVQVVFAICQYVVTIIPVPYKELRLAPIMLIHITSLVVFSIMGIHTDWIGSHSLLVTILSTVKPVLSSHSKIDKTKILMTNGSVMKVESIAECSPWSILQ